MKTFLLKLSLLILSVFIMSEPVFSKSISLNGKWNFTIDSLGEYNIDKLPTEWRETGIPSSWQSQFEDLRDYQGIAWYQKKFTSPERRNNDKVFIKFDAVDYIADVYINKKHAGKHEGGYTPFKFDITEYLTDDENEIVLRVMDPANDSIGTEGISYWHIPHGKQTWYVQTSGIWQNVQILVKPEKYIESVFITPTIDGNIKFDVNLNEPSEENINIKVTDPDGKQVIMEEVVTQGINTRFEKKIRNPQLWSFNSPELYSVEITFGEDCFKDRFGFRSIETRDKRLYLNGEPFYLIGALDQDFYPETIYTTPSEEYMRDQMIKAKEMGLNLLRCHIKVPDPLYLKVADELGILIWYEVPNWDVFTPEAALRGSQTMDEMLRRDWNHPSIVILSIINESWGIDFQKEDQRKWLLDEFNRLKDKATGRLVVDNSSCWGNFHIKTDLNDHHTYSAIPENVEDFNLTINNLSKRPDWLFSSFGDSHETRNEPLLLSEFGNWGLPKLTEKLPWWINRPFLDIEVSLPAGFQDRFNKYQYDKIFKSYNDLAEESQKAQYNALKYEIETIRLNPEFSGYVITEFTDINWEVNGLLDMWRNYKVGSKELASIQQQDIIIPKQVKYSYSAGDKAEIQLFISHYSSKDLQNAKLKWSFGKEASGVIDLPSINRTEVKQISPVVIQLPAELKQSQKMTCTFTLLDVNGKEIANNFQDIFVFNFNQDKVKHEITISGTSDILNTFRNVVENDFSITNGSPTIITEKIDEKLLSLLSEGRNVICFVDSNTIVPEEFPYKITSRNEEWYDGNWASNLNWLRDENNLFKDLSFNKSFGFEIAGCAPKYVVSGIPAESFNDVLAGMYIGWLHLNSGYIVQMKGSKGNLILCSFPVLSTYSKEPFSKKLFTNLIKYINSKDFNPKLTWSNE